MGTEEHVDIPHCPTGWNRQLGGIPLNKDQLVHFHYVILSG